MANPQWEDGYVKIANEVMDAFVKIRIPGEARQVLDFVIRKTWGFGKKADFISISQMSKATGLPKSSVYRALKNLLDTNLVTKKQRGVYEKVDTYVSEWRFNKDYETWRVSTKKQRGVYEKVTEASTKKYTGGSTKKYTTKETNTKEILTKEKSICELPQKTESRPDKFNCSSLEIAEWVNAHDGFHKLTPECIKTLLEEFTAPQILDALKRCNSWIGTGNRQVSNINITLNKFMDDCRKSRDSQDINAARGICTDPSQLKGGYVEI